MSNRHLAATRRAFASLLMAVAVPGLAVACDVEADLVAYFGTPLPSPAPATGAPPTDPGRPTPSGQPTTTPPGSATPPPITEPTGEPPPTGEPGPTATPAWSPMPTRPPNLAAFATLRERAREVGVDQLATRPADFVGTTVYFEGRVNQIVEDRRGNVRARVKIGDSFIQLLYNTGEYFGDHPLVQGDRVKVVGDFIGLADDRAPEIDVIDILHRFS